MTTSPLSESDRLILKKRANFLWTFMKYLYGAVAIGVCIYIVKNVVSYESLDNIEFEPILIILLLIIGATAVSYSLLLIWEKPIKTIIKRDLDDGVKIVLNGTLIKTEGSGDDPVCLFILEERTNEIHEFELRSISDILRIKYIGLEHKAVTIEYAPNSKIVFCLRAQKS